MHYPSSSPPQSGVFCKLNKYLTLFKFLRQAKFHLQCRDEDEEINNAFGYLFNPNKLPQVIPTD